MRKVIILMMFLYHAGSLGQVAPAVELTGIPAWGEVNPLEGRVHNTTPGNHGIAVYIFLEEAGGWWNKPYAAGPVTPIRPDSTFITNINTSETDRYATRIIAFLIPVTFLPPVLPGGELPETLFTYPYTVACRPHGDRKISWSGYEWIVKRSIGDPMIPVGPGPGIFNDNDSMVFVDGLDRLHLRIAHTGNEWHCTEVICTSNAGYGTSDFDIASRLDLLDPNVIAGLFTWDDCSPFAQPPNNWYREIDFEFSRWGIAGNVNSQFVVQPFDVPGNIRRFNMDLDGTDHSRHVLRRTPDSIVFLSAWGDSAFSWTYDNAEFLPSPGGENIRINFHLLNNLPPTDLSDAELVLNSFKTGTSSGEKTAKDMRIFPNPFRDECHIEIMSPGAKDVKVFVMDINGRRVRSLFSGALNPGLNQLEWNGRSDSGTPLHAGIYLLGIKDSRGCRYYKLIKQ